MNEEHRFKRVILPHLDHLHSVARSVVRDRSCTGDLVLETLKTARSRYRENSVRSDLRPWLTNLMKEVWRTKFRTDSESASGDREYTLPNDRGERDRATQALTFPREEITFDDIRRALFRIPNQYRRLLVLSLSDEFDLNQVSEVMNLSRSTVRFRYRHAKQLLKKRLKEMGDDTCSTEPRG